MALLARMVACPLAIEVRSGAVAALPGLLSDGRISAGGHVAVVVGPGSARRSSPRSSRRSRTASSTRVSGGSVAAALGLVEELREGSHDAVVGIGGGRTLDVAKYAASQAGLPMVSVATNLAHDGIASPVASLEDEEGRKGSYGVHIPIAVVVDLDYVRRSPEEQIRSGIGDALSNLSALADWELAAEDRGEAIDGLAVTFARSGAESLVSRTDDSARRLPHHSRRGARPQRARDGGRRLSRPCSGACHEISHAIDALYPEPASHGEQVAVGRAVRLLPARGRGSSSRSTPRCAATACRACPPTSASTDDEFAAAVARPRPRGPTGTRSSSTSTWTGTRSATGSARYVDAFDR